MSEPEFLGFYDFERLNKDGLTQTGLRYKIECMSCKKLFIIIVRYTNNLANKLCKECFDELEIKNA